MIFSLGVFLSGKGKQYWVIPPLGNIIQRKNMLVSTVLVQTPVNIGFRGTFNEHNWNQWLHLCHCLMPVQLSNEPGKFVWKISESGIFSVKSMYLDLMNGHTRFLRKYLWKIKIALKLK
jgi:hypothetical protein